VYEHKDGRRYEGGFENNQRSGHGVQKYADGAVYTGDWSRDLRHGMGEFKNTSGVPYTYKGLWKVNKHCSNNYHHHHCHLACTRHW
jgi:hypothetical protein